VGTASFCYFSACSSLCSYSFARARP
jgi:hypothetical protein